MLHIHDPTIITKHNPAGLRPATQSDIDHLQRVAAAFAHVTPYVMVCAPIMVQEAKDIIAGHALARMTEAEMTEYMLAEDERTGVDKPAGAAGLTILDHQGNVMPFDIGVVDGES